MKLLLEKLGSRQVRAHKLRFLFFIFLLWQRWDSWPYCQPYHTEGNAETWYCATVWTNLKCSPSQCSRPISERRPVPVEFLPLNYLTNMLAEIENQGNLNSLEFNYFGRPVSVTLRSHSAISWQYRYSWVVKLQCSLDMQFGFLSADGNCQSTWSLCIFSSKSSTCWIQLANWRTEW